jgi:hypothetical protein
MIKYLWRKPHSLLSGYYWCNSVVTLRLQKEVSYPVLAASPSGMAWYPLYRRLGGPQNRSGWMWKFSPPLEFDRRRVQPVACRYTHYATSTASNILEGIILGSNTDLEQFHPLAISFARICDKLLCRKALCMDWIRPGGQTWNTAVGGQRKACSAIIPTVLYDATVTSV